MPNKPWSPKRKPIILKDCRPERANYYGGQRNLQIVSFGMPEKNVSGTAPRTSQMKLSQFSGHFLEQWRICCQWCCQLALRNLQLFDTEDGGGEGSRTPVLIAICLSFYMHSRCSALRSGTTYDKVLHPDSPVCFRFLNRRPDLSASPLGAPPTLVGVGWETSLVKQRERIR